MPLEQYQEKRGDKLKVKKILITTTTKNNKTTNKINLEAQPRMEEAQTFHEEPEGPYMDISFNFISFISFSNF